MTKEQQRIKIAETCGWNVKYPDHYPNPMGFYKQEESCRPIPDYLNDLNAIHEAEKVMTESEFAAYRWTLWDLCKEPELTKWSRNYLSATAPQRAEAFLKTLNLWNDNE